MPEDKPSDAKAVEDKKIDTNTTSSPPPTKPDSVPVPGDKPADKTADKPADKPKPAFAPAGAMAGKPAESKPEAVPTPAMQISPGPSASEIEPGETIPKEPGVAEVKIEEPSYAKATEKNAVDELVEQAKEEVETFDQQVDETKVEPQVKEEVKSEAPTTAVKPSYAEATEGKEEKVKVVAPSEAASIVPFVVKFLKHLGILRGQANQKRQENIQDRLDKIMAYAIKHQKITNDEVERLTGVGHRQAVRYLNILVKDKKLVRFGKKSNIFYKPIN
jgi:hypothetical protein